MSQEKENAWVNHSKKFKSNVNEMKWKDDEENRIRILPVKKDAEKNLFAYASHWIDLQTGNRAPVFHSPDKPCKICKLVNKLWQDVNRLKEEGYTDESPELKKKKDLIYKIRAKNVFDMNVLDRKDYKDDEGNIKIKRLSATPGIHKFLVELAEDGDWGSPSHDETGYDIKVGVDYQGEFKKFNVGPAGRSVTPLTEEEIEALNESGYDLVELRKKEFSSEVKINEVLENAKRKELQKLALISKSVLDDDDDDEDEVDEVEIDEDEEDEVEIDEDDDEDEKPKVKKRKTKEEPKKSKKKAKVVEEEDEDDDEDEEEEEEKPKKKKKAKKEEVVEEEVEEEETDDEDEEEEKPKPKKKKAKKEEVVEDEEEEADEEVDTEDEEEDDSEDAEEEENSDEDFESNRCRGCHDEYDEDCEACDFNERCKDLTKLKTKAEKAGIEVEDEEGKVLLEDELNAKLAEVKPKKKKAKKLEF